MWFFLAIIIILVVSISILANQLFSWLRTSRRVVTMNSLRTGDVLGTSAMGPHSYLFSMAGIHTGHLMMIVREDDTGDVNILEISGYHDNPAAECKPCIRPLADRLQYKDYDSFGTIWSYQGPHIPSQSIHEFLEQVKDCKFNYRFVGEHVKQRFLGSKRSMTRDKLCCSELVYLGLVHAGVIKFNESDWVDSFRYLTQLPTHSEPKDLSTDLSATY